MDYKVKHAPNVVSLDHNIAVLGVECSPDGSIRLTVDKASHPAEAAALVDSFFGHEHPAFITGGSLFTVRCVKCMPASSIVCFRASFSALVMFFAFAFACRARMEVCPDV